MTPTQPEVPKISEGKPGMGFTLATLVEPSILGFAFHLAWLCLFMYDVIPEFAGNEDASFDALNPVYFFSAISLMVTLCFGIIRTRSFMQLVRSKAGCHAAPIVCSIGTLFYALCAMNVVPETVETPLLLFGGIMTGLSSAMLAAHWASVFGRAKARAVIMNFTVILVAVLIACLAISYLFPTTSLIVATLLPLASGASLIYADSRAVESSMAKDPQNKRRHNQKPYAILIVAVALLGLSTGCLPQFSNDGSNFDQLFYSLTSIIVLGTIGWLVAKEERGALPMLFVAPLCVLGIFALPYIRFTENDAAGLFYAMGNASLELMLLFEAVLFALLFDFSCARTFMIARLTMAVSDLGGWFLSSAIIQAWGTGAAMQAAATAILIGSEVIIAALIGTYLLLRRRSLTTSALNTRAAGVDSLGSEGADGPGENRRTAQNGADSAAHDIATAASLTAKQFGLSPREADVLGLLVAGESTAQIQESLCIAPGTFNYHIRNIYAKLGVHSRQELLIFVRNQEEQQKQ